VVGKRVGNTPERLRFLAVAPNGDLFLRENFSKTASEVTPTEVAARRK